MKKVLVLAAMAVFSSLYTNIWGAVTPDVSGKTATFSGTGTLSTTSTWRSNNSGITTVVINEGVTAIAANAFSGMTKITSVKLPSSLTSIGTDAFLNCSTIVKIYYADSPNAWAGIAISNDAAHPFKGGGASDHDFYFYGSESATTTLVLTPPIDTIKQFAFYNSHFSYINIPGTVTSIEEKALYCTISSRSAINCRTAPSLGTSAITSGTDFYIPTGATGYNVSPWSSHTTNQAVSGTISDTYGAGITWVLDANGVLTLNATTENKEITFTGESAYNQYPWANFRRLVHKVVLQGEISELSQTFTYCWGLSEITLDQATVPTFTTDKAKIAFGSLFNSRDNVVLKVKPAALVSASASNLSSAPWNNARLDIALSETATFYERALNTDTLEAIKTYIELPFSLQLKRTLSNAYYNTFCSPIPISKAQIEDTWGEGTYAHAFESTEYDEEKDSLTLNFTEEIEGIEAGVPYLIQPENNVANPTFTNVVPSTIVTEPATVTPVDAAASFVGTILSENVTEEWAEAEIFIFLKADNKLTFATTGTLRGMRAYFLLDKDVSASALAKAPGLRIGHSEHIATATEHIPHDAAHNASKIIRNGQLVIVRDGAEYNAQGVRIN